MGAEPPSRDKDYAPWIATPPTTATPAPSSAGRFKLTLGGTFRGTGIFAALRLVL